MKVYLLFLSTLAMMILSHAAPQKGVLLRALRSPQDEPPKLVAINSGDVAVSDENAEIDKNTKIAKTIVEEMSETTTEAIIQDSENAEIDTTTIVKMSEKTTEAISKGNESTETDTKTIEETGDTTTAKTS